MVGYLSYIVLDRDTEIEVSITVRCPFCIKEVDMDQLKDHMETEHTVTVDENLLDKILNLIIRWIYHDIIEVLERVKDNIEHISLGLLKPGLPTTGSLYLAQNTMSLHLTVHSLNEIIEELTSDKSLGKVLENSYLARYSIYRIHRLSDVLNNLMILGDLAGGLETIALIARQLVEEIELSAVLDLHKDLKGLELDKKIEKAGQILHDGKILQLLLEVIGREKIENVLPGSRRTAEEYENVVDLLKDTYRWLSSIVHGDPSLAMTRMKTSSQSTYKASTYWNMESELPILIEIATKAYDAFTLVVAIWIKNIIENNEIAKDRIKKLFEPFQPIMRISVNI